MQRSQLSAEIFGLVGDILQSLGAFAQEQGVAQLLVGTQPGPQTLRHGEGYQIIWHRQEPELLVFNPLAGVVVSTLRTGAVVAGMKDKMVPAAVRTAVKLPAQGAGAAGQNALHRAAMRGKDVRSKPSFIRRPMPAQDFRQWDHPEASRLRLQIFSGWNRVCKAAWVRASLMAVR